jgi:hypothetical protein
VLNASHARVAESAGVRHVTKGAWNASISSPLVHGTALLKVEKVALMAMRTRCLDN